MHKEKAKACCSLRYTPFLFIYNYDQGRKHDTIVSGAFTKNYTLRGTQILGPSALRNIRGLLQK